MKVIALMLILLPVLASGNPSICIAEIMHSEAGGESLEGLIAVAQASLNRSKVTNTPVCHVKGATRKKLPFNLAPHYMALAQSIINSKISIIGKADSWERSKHPRLAGHITRRIGKHTFYIMKGLR